MEKQIGKDQPAISRASFLSDNCDKVVEMGYMKRFTPEQIQEKKEQLSETDIKINDNEEAKKEVLKDFKVQLKPLTDQRKQLLTNIKQKAEYITEKCYKFIDNEDKMVGFYNSEGELVESRPATVDELQGTIFQISRTGTN
jgi:hypothetical protein